MTPENTQFRNLIPMMFCLCCISSLLQGSVFSQQVDTFAIARGVNHQTGSYSFDGNGRLKTGLMQTIANTNALFFEDEVIQLEIELVDDQKTKFKSILKTWQSSWQETIEKIARDYKKSPISREEVQERIAENDEASISKIREVLLPHQLAIINELQLRCLFRTQGMNVILKSGELQKLLNLSESESAKILKAAKSMRKQVSDMAIVVRAKTLKLLLESLSADEAIAFSDKWRHLFEDKHQCSLEELIVFLDPVRYAWINEEKEPITKLIGRPNFETGAAGNLITKPGNKYSNVELNVFRSFWKNKTFANWIGLSEDEKNDVQEIVKASYQSSQILINENIVGQESSNEPFEVRNKRAKKRANAMDAKSVREIKELLGDEGWDRVETFATRINIASAGPVYDLVEGELSEFLKFTSAQKDTLKNNAKNALEFLTKETAKIEEYVLDEMASTLDEKRSKKFKAAFGSPVKNAPVNIDLMLMNMGR